MAKSTPVRLLIFASAFSFAAFTTRGEDTSGNLITNGGFEAGMQIWKGDGKILLLPEGNRVCEIEASKSRMKDVRQDFHMKKLQQVEVVFRARGVGYTGPGIRVSIHQPGAGFLFWNKELPEDGGWREFHVKYTRTTANMDTRELVIETLLGTGKIQIDDVEVREPGKMGENQIPTSSAPSTPRATPAPLGSARPFATPSRSPATPPPPSAAPPGTIRSIEQIVNSAPQEALRKLQDSGTAAEGMAEINQYFSQNLIDKPVLLRVKVELAAESPPGGRNRFRIKGPDRVIRGNGGTLSTRLWAYFPEGTMPEVSAVPIGEEVTVSGVIGRCDVTTKDSVRLNLDLQQSKIEAP